MNNLLSFTDQNGDIRCLNLDHVAKAVKYSDPLLDKKIKFYFTDNTTCTIVFGTTTDRENFCEQYFPSAYFGEVLTVEGWLI